MLGRVDCRRKAQSTELAWAAGLLGRGTSARQADIPDWPTGLTNGLDSARLHGWPASLAWPVPTSAKELRSFLGLRLLQEAIH